MTDFSFVVGVIVFPPHHIKRMAKGRDVDEPVVHREDERTHEQPNEHEGNVDATTNGNGEENHAHDGVGDGLHDRIDAIVNGFLCVQNHRQARHGEKGETLNHRKGIGIKLGEAECPTSD